MIDVKELYFSYDNKETYILKDLSFRIEEGQIFGFLGPSGAGKSTTQKILIRLLRDFQGEIRILNKNIHHWKDDFYNYIGVGFELPNHYQKLSAKENLNFFAGFYDRPCKNPEDLLESVGLGPEINKRVSQFSKGMKMRLNFVRALMHDPPLLFFDEPTSGLDPVNAKKLKDMILNQKKQGKTIFLTTHNMYDAEELCDQVAFLVGGEIKLVDAPHKLKMDFGTRKLKVNFENDKVKQEIFELDNLGNNPRFREILNNYKIQAMHTEEANLNDVFIKVTGKSLF